MTTKKHPLLVNLRKSRAPLTELVHIGMDYILQRPIHELFNTNELSKAIALGIRSVAAEPRNEELLEKQIHASIAELQRSKFDGKLSEHTVDAIRGLAATPVKLNEELVAQLLDHSATRVLLREVIQLSVMNFSERAAAVIPGGNMVHQFAIAFRGFAARTVTSDGMTVEMHINGAVEDNLSPALRSTAARVADENFAAELADWRGHVLNVLLDRPIKELIGQLDQVSPKELAGQLAALLQSIASWNKLDQVVQKSVQASLVRVREQTLNDILQGTGTEKDLRPIVEKQLVKALWPFLKSAEFEAWLNEWSEPKRRAKK
jgi:hypothetical protein